jgi:hypothetical protein
VINLGNNILINENELYWVEKVPDSFALRLLFRSSVAEQILDYDTEVECHNDFMSILHQIEENSIKK